MFRCISTIVQILSWRCDQVQKVVMIAGGYLHQLPTTKNKAHQKPRIGLAWFLVLHMNIPCQGLRSKWQDDEKRDKASWWSYRVIHLETLQNVRYLRSPFLFEKQVNQMKLEEESYLSNLCELAMHDVRTQLKDKGSKLKGWSKRN
ncbi:hypothetical protein AKJ16_DCAP19571 [Drosera capensis]